MLSTLRLFISSGVIGAWLLATLAAAGTSEQLPASPNYVIAIKGPSQIPAEAPVLHVRLAIGNAGASPAPAVKVKFFFDDKPETHWVRVMQMQTSGSMILPRMSWETEVRFDFETGELRVGKHRFCAMLEMNAPASSTGPSSHATGTSCFDFTVSSGSSVQPNVQVPIPSASPSALSLLLPSFPPQSPQPLPSPKMSFGPECVAGEYTVFLCRTPQPTPPPSCEPKSSGPCVEQTCDPKLYGPCAPQPSVYPSINCLKSSPGPEDYERIKFCYGTIESKYSAPPSPRPEPTATPNTRLFHYPLPETAPPSPMARAGPRVFGPASARSGEMIAIALVIPESGRSWRSNEFDLCLVSQVSFPRLDASSKNVCYVSVKLQPEYLRWTSPSPQKTLRADLKFTLPRSTPAGKYVLCPFVPYDFRFQSHPGDPAGCASIKIQ